MALILPIIIIFTALFLCLSIWILKSEKEELKEKRARFHHVLGTALILAIVPTVILALIIFALFGSVNIVNTLFSFDISAKRLTLLTLALLIYLFTLDYLVEKSIEIIVEKNIAYTIILFLTRVFAFYMIGFLFNLKQISNFILASGAALIIFLFDIYQLKMANES